MTEARSCITNRSRQGERWCLFKLLLLTMALLCGCAGARGPLRYRLLGVSRVVLSSDGTKAAFSYDLSGKQTDGFSSRRYLIVDLRSGTPMKWGPFTPDRPIWDSVLWWSEKREAFVIERNWRPGTKKALQPQSRSALLIVSPAGGERTVHIWPPTAVREEGPGRVHLFGLTARQDGVLLAENVGSNGIETQKQRVGILDLDTGQQSSFGFLPSGWRCWEMGAQAENGPARRLWIVAKREEQTDPQTALFVADKAGVRRSAPLPPQTYVPNLTSQASVLAFVVERREDVYDVRILPLVGGVGETRTVLTMEGRRPLLWAPNGRELLVWAMRFPGSRDERSPWWIIDAVTGATKRIDLRWKSVDEVTWEPQGKSLLVIADGALWRLNPHDNSTQRVMAIPSPPR